MKSFRLTPLVRQAIIWSVLLMALLSGCGAQPGPSTPAFSGNLPITAPETIKAGEGAAVKIGPADAADGTAITLVANGSFGSRVYQGKFAGKEAVFNLPGSDTTRSGYVTLFASAGDGHGEGSFSILPGPAVEPVQPLVGPRQLIADAGHYTMVVTIPFDRYGNPLAEDTPVQVQAQDPGSKVDNRSVPIKHLLAWTRLFSGTKAGRTVISTQAGSVYGPAAEVDEVPGPPVAFTVSTEPETAPADGHRLLTLRTSSITDQYRNVVPDGTLVTVIITEQGGQQRSLPAYTIGGVAQTPLTAADEPGICQVKAVAYGVESPTIQVAFTPPSTSGTFSLKASLDRARGVIQLKAGPLLGNLNQYLPDGTTVLFHVLEPKGGGRWLSGETVAGQAVVEVSVGTLLAGQYRVEAFAGGAGGQTVFQLPWPD